MAKVRCPHCGGKGAAEAHKLDPNSELLTPCQVAVLLSVHVRTFHRMVQTGRLKVAPVRWSRKLVRYRRSEIFKAIEVMCADREG